MELARVTSLFTNYPVCLERFIALYFKSFYKSKDAETTGDPMITTDQDRITALTAAGSWGTDTLHSLLKRHAATQPECLAVKDQPNRESLTGEASLSLNWLELSRASDNLARSLQAAGLGEDDRIIIQLPNVCELLVVYYAISKMGAIASQVPV